MKFACEHRGLRLDAPLLAGGQVLLLGGTSRLTPVVGVAPNPTVASSWTAVDRNIDPYRDLSSISAKMGNTLAASTRLQRT